MMNKKAQTMVFLVVIFAVITMFVIITFLGKKYEEEGLNEGIGTYASGLISAYQKEEKAMLYLDVAAKQALRSSLFEIGNEAGILEKGECGSNIYNLWNYEDKDCVPDVEENLKTIFLEKLRPKLYASPIPISGNFDLTFEQKGEDLELTGTTDDKVSLAITTSGETYVHREITGDVGISEETINRINQYEDIIQKASHDTGVSVSLIKAVITQESRGEKHAISYGACAGIMQFCYPTAQDFFELSELVDIKTECLPKRNNRNVHYTYTCSQSVYTKDARFYPAKEIPAGAEYLRQIYEFGNIKGMTTDKDLATIAAYNGGQGLISRAIDRTDNPDPTWEEISAQLTRNLLRNIGSDLYNSYSDEKLDKKIEEIRDYVNKVGGYYYAWGGEAPQTTVTTSFKGYYEFEQNFKTSIDYDLSILKDVKTFVEEAIDECDDEVENCLEEKRVNFNEKYSGSNTIIVPLEECEDEKTKVFYDFLENMNTCAFAWGDECRCQVTEDYAAAEIKVLNDKYAIRFLEKGENNLYELPQEESVEIQRALMLYLPRLFKDVYLNSELEIKPTKISFEYEESTINSEIEFINHAEEEPNGYKAEDFEKVYLIVKGDEYSWMVEDKEGNSIEIKKKNLFGENLEVETIENECPVAKKTFNLCLKTSYYYPSLTEEGLEYEEQRVKFAIYLNDTEAPEKVDDLKVTVRNAKNIVLEWTEETDDVALYEIHKSISPYTSINLKPSFEKKFVYEAEEMPLSEDVIGPLSPENFNYQENILFYRDLEDKREYRFVIDTTRSLALLAEKTQSPTGQLYFSVTATDNFKNQDYNVNTATLTI